MTTILEKYPIIILFSFVVAIITQIITLHYLGASFNDKDLKVDDWKRKWLIFFAYFNIIASFLSPEPTYVSVLSIMSSTITLCYLGTSFDLSKNDVIKSNDWKRRWLIVMAYINIVLLSIIILGSLGIVSLYGIKKN